VEMEQAASLNPVAERITTTLVGLYVGQKKFDKAVALCEERIRRKTGDETAYDLLAQVHVARNDYPKAIDVYRKVLHAKPDLWLAANNMAFLMGESAGNCRELDEALSWARKAQQLKPEEGTVLDTMGWIYYKKGDANKAVEYLARAQAKAPGSRVIDYHMGMAFYKAGNKAEARKHLSKAVDGKADFAGKEEAKKILAQM
jgi:tetratricopeptide (TPR) repeat protein